MEIEKSYREISAYFVKFLSSPILYHSIAKEIPK